MEFEYIISSLVGATIGGGLVMFGWMLSPDFVDAERYRWLKATAKTESLPELWDAALDAVRENEALQASKLSNPRPKVSSQAPS